MNVPIHRLRSKSRSDRLLQLTRLVGGANLDHTCHTASSAVIIECFYKSSVSEYINGHFHIYQTDWTSSLKLTDIP